MSQEIATGTFYILAITTMILQIVMWYERSKFLRTIKGQSVNLINLKGSRYEEMGTMLQVVFPVKLQIVQGGQLEELRKSAVKASRNFIISLILTFILPIILFNLTE